MENTINGFTLIELMIVIAIISILASIGIPYYTVYQLNSKRAEAISNIGSIKTLQLIFKAEHDGYCPCGRTLANPDMRKQPWTPALTNNGFNAIGFAPLGDVYYSYEVAVAGGVNFPNVGNSGLIGQSGAFCVSALGDLDGDTNAGEFGFATDFLMVPSTLQIAGNCTRNYKIENLMIGNY